MTELVAAARVNALQLRLDAMGLGSQVTSKLHWATHTTKLTEIKELINSLAVTMGRVNQIRESGSRGQQEAADRITFALNELAVNVNTAIEHLSANREQLERCVAMDPEYKAILAQTEVLASKLTSLITRFGRS